MERNGLRQLLAVISRIRVLTKSGIPHRDITFQRTDAHHSEVRAGTGFAHAAAQLIDVECESYRSIMGATHNRCDKSFISLTISTFGRPNEPLERLVILSLGRHDCLRCPAAQYSQIGSRIRLRGWSVHKQRTRVGHTVRAHTPENPQ